MDENRFPVLRQQFPHAGKAEWKKAWHALQTAYNEPGRYYHNMAHVAAMLDLLDEKSPENPAMELAIWFHDAVYDANARDNEDQSASLFLTLLGRSVPEGLADDVVRLILATRHGTPPTARTDEQLMRDIDLSILAAPPPVYQEYADAIRREYAHVPEDAFRKGRAAVLRNFLASPVFTTQAFARSEGAARANVKAELEALERISPPDPR